jgi:hypothetical protein
MRRVRFLPLLLILGLAAAGSYSAFAGSGSVADKDTPAVSVERANEGEGDSPSIEQQGGEGAEETQRADKVAQAIADEFGVTKEEVLARHNEGIGFGALFKLYKLARAQGISVDELLAGIPTDANGERQFGFGQLRKALTAEQRASFESGPKNLGKLVSAASKKHDEPTASPTGDGGAGEQSGASGHVPPGQAKKAAKR